MKKFFDKMLAKLKKYIFLFVVLFAVFVSETGDANAALTIDPVDKYFIKDGEKTFMFSSGGMSNFMDKYNPPPQENCEITISHNPEMDFDYLHYRWGNLHAAGCDDAFNAAGIYFMGYTGDDILFENNNEYLNYWINMPYFFGLSHADEPDLTGEPLSSLKYRYDRAHQEDPSHLVFLNMAGVTYTQGEDKGKAGNLNYFKNVADVFMWDKWTKTDGHPWTPIEDNWLYAQDRESERTALYGINDLETWDKPAIGFSHTITANDAAPHYRYSLKETRAEMYLMIIYGVKGIQFYPNKNDMMWSGSSYRVPGSWNSPETYNYLNDVLAKEVHGFDWLFLPSVAKSWGSEHTNHQNFTEVGFSNNPSKTIIAYGGSATLKRFNYMLKKKDDNHHYLIVVNKDKESTTTDITIASLIGKGNRTATTIGLEPDGTAKKGVSHPVINGTFADTFDGFATHVYEISSSDPDTTPPAISSTDPVNNANNVPITKTIATTFNENIQAGVNYNSITLKDSNNNPISFTKSISGNTLTIDPTPELDYTATYTVAIPASSVKDISNNNLARPVQLFFYDIC